MPRQFWKTYAPIVGAEQGWNMSYKGKRSIRRSRGYSAKSAAVSRMRNRIYLAILIVKALAILFLSVTHEGFHCG